MNKKLLVVFFSGCLAAGSARAQGYAAGTDFVVTHPTVINQIGAYDGGTAFTSDETVGIFDVTTGDLVGSDVVFGPGIAGTQVGNTFFESVTPFNLPAGEYFAITIGGNGPVGSGLSGVNSYQNLGGALDLPGGSRFNAGSIGEVLPNIGITSSSGVVLVDPPPVPDGGVTVVLLGGALAGLGWLRRKV